MPKYDGNIIIIIIHLLSVKKGTIDRVITKEEKRKKGHKHTLNIQIYDKKNSFLHILH